MRKPANWTVVRVILPPCNKNVVVAAATEEMQVSQSVAKHLVQYGALPFRWSRDGFQFMLVTSRGKRRWIIPKGWPIPGLAPHECAAREALEEAGLIGFVQTEAIGAFRTRKRLRNGALADCLVQVYPLEVTARNDHWPEKDERETGWFNAAAAMELVSDVDLKNIIQAFAEFVQDGSRSTG